RCLIDRYRELGVHVIVLGKLRQTTLEYEIYDTWTRARAFEGKVQTTGVTSATLQRHIGEIVRPVGHRGGLLDQRPAAQEPPVGPPRPEASPPPEASPSPEASPPHRFDILPFVIIALIVIVMAPVLFLWLLLRRGLLEVARPASWTLSAVLV